jgi:hypothetical protein
MQKAVLLPGPEQYPRGLDDHGTNDARECDLYYPSKPLFHEQQRPTPVLPTNHLVGENSSTKCEVVFDDLWIEFEPNLSHLQKHHEIEERRSNRY